LNNSLSPKVRSNHMHDVLGGHALLNVHITRSVHTFRIQNHWMQFYYSSCSRGLSSGQYELALGIK
jgi:hypothetical protein